MEDVILEYYNDNAKKLHAVVDKLLKKFGGISEKDRDDFYSLANEVFTKILSDYDSKCGSFDGYLYFCLDRKIKTEMTSRNRQKRQADRMSVSIDTPIGDDNNETIADIIPDSFDLEKKVIEETKDVYSDKMSAYLERLSEVQRKILELLAIGYIGSEISEELHISDKEYSEAVETIRSYRNVLILL